MAQNVQKFATLALDFSKAKLTTFVKYARVEMKPPTPGEFPEVIRGFRNVVSGYRTGRWRQLTVREAWVNTLVATEVLMWFFVGEIIGRRRIAGYFIPA
uniref:ATP synthase subunit g n=1 Tax=Romanomermis culicivorax TaxID=13658 RepID=A0A915HGY5_ROMCU